MPIASERVLAVCTEALACKNALETLDQTMQQFLRAKWATRPLDNPEWDRLYNGIQMVLQSVHIPSVASILEENVRLQVNLKKNRARRRSAALHRGLQRERDEGAA